jgi:hypothetical protein
MPTLPEKVPVVPAIDDVVVEPIDVLSIVPPVIAAAEFSVFPLLRLLRLSSISLLVNGLPFPDLVTIVTIIISIH